MTDAMNGLDMLNAIALERIQLATVGEAIATQEVQTQSPADSRGADNERNTAASARSDFRSQIELQLGDQIEIIPVARSFSEIERALF